MTRPAVLGLCVLITASCGEIDRGRCLRSHVEAHHRDEEFVCLPTIGFDGTVGLGCQWEPARDWTETVCDQWEFPNGKAEKG